MGVYKPHVYIFIYNFVSCCDVDCVLALFWCSIVGEVLIVKEYTCSKLPALFFTIFQIMLVWVCSCVSNVRIQVQIALRIEIDSLGTKRRKALNI